MVVNCYRNLTDALGSTILRSIKFLKPHPQNFNIYDNISFSSAVLRVTYRSRSILHSRNHPLAPEVRHATIPLFLTPISLITDGVFTGLPVIEFSRDVVVPGVGVPYRAGGLRQPGREEIVR